jgi:hypothetical protein
MNPGKTQQQTLDMLKLKLTIFRMLVTYVNKVYLRINIVDGFLVTWLGKVLKRCDTRGTVDTIGWLKALRLCYHRYMGGTPLDTSPGFGIQLNKDGLPNGETELNELFVSRDPFQIRFGNTLLGVSRILPGWKSPDLLPITQPYKGDYDLRVIGDALAGLVRELGWAIPLPRWEECHVTTKSGPNAQALIGSVEDAHLLSEEQISNLQILGGDAVVERLKLVKSVSILAWLRNFTNRRGETLSPKSQLSKLSLVKDKEAKCRVVAILDYWTQSTLFPLHKALMALLRRQKPDCTFNQGSFRSKLPSHGPFYSIDLSSATDRVPVAIQEPVLGALVGNKEYAAAWRQLLTEREYSTSWGNKSRVKYGVGQPMGAYSSWTMFSVTHHLIVRYAAKKVGLTANFNRYVLLGDDIVIAHEAVAKEYMAIMGGLGVDISEAKTFISHDMYEFAKRVILRGTEVTPAPFGSMFDAIRFVSEKTLKANGGNMLPTKAIKRISFYETAVWFRELEARWLLPSETLVSRSLFANLFALLGRGALSERLAEKAWRFFLLPSREDSRLLRHTKCEKLGLVLLGGSLGCFSWKRSTERICVLLNECKARVLEEAIKRHLGALRGFQLEAAKYLSCLPEGLDAQSLLLSLPPFAVLRRNIAELQLEFDKARAVRSSDDLSGWLHLDVRLFLDPFQTLSTRKSKTNASNKVTIMNHLTAMCRGIEYIRELALTDISLDGLVNVIQNHHVLPSRGDRRNKPKLPPRQATPTGITDTGSLGKKS